MDTNNKIGALCYWMTTQEQGKELLDSLTKLLQNDPVLPKPKEMMESFGGAEMFCAFRAGQASLVKFIELHATGYIQQENALKEAQNKKDEKIAARAKKRGDR